MKKLEDYINNQLIETEEDDFLQTLFEAKQKEDLKEDWRQKLEEQYGSTAEKGPNPPKKNLPFYSVVLSLAASIALIFGLLFLFPNSSSDYNSLAESYIQTAPFANNLDARGNNQSEEFRTIATSAYKKGDYQAAISAYEQAIKQGEKTVEDHFFLGLSYLYNNQFDQASLFLSESLKLSKSNGEFFEEEIRWFLALAQIKSGAKEDAIRTLKNIKEGHWQYSKSQELLNALSH